MSARKLLSIVIVGRNDDYLGGYRYRLQTCLDFLAANLKTLGRLDDVEVLFVDWNSQGAPLSDEIELTPEAAALMRFVIVPPAVAKARNPMAAFFTTCAVNVGVRRAVGAFIMLADSDSMMPLPSLKALLEVLDGTLPTHAPKEQLIYPIPRHQIPGSIAARRPNVAAWVEILKRITGSRRKELPAGDCLGGFSAAQLMHRDLWFEFGGYSEKLDRAWGWSDNDLMFRVTQKYNWMDLGYYGVIAFHIEHFASKGIGHSRDPDSINAMALTYDAHPNDEGWGLATMTLQERRVAGRVRLEPAPHWNPLKGALSADDFLALRGDPEIADLIKNVGHPHRNMGDRGRADYEAVSALTVLLLREHPRNVVHVGALYWPVLMTLLETVAGTDLFLVQPWREGVFTAEPTLTGAPGNPGMLAIGMTISAYRGYARILSNRAPLALDALFASDPLAQSIELAVIDRGEIEEDFARVLARIADHLAPNGAILITDEQHRLPITEEDARVFVARQLARGEAHRDVPEGANDGVFVQGGDEALSGAAFDVLSLGGGGACLVRKRAAEAVQPAAIAAE